jgi:hypothetical protein
MFVPTFVVLLGLASIVRGQSQSGPVCFQDCVFGSCTDLTHTNCVCTQHTGDIKACVVSTCNAADQVLAQQIQAGICGILSFENP